MGAVMPVETGCAHAGNQPANAAVVPPAAAAPIKRLLSIFIFAPVKNRWF
jgi:hypothetical protein